MIIKPKITTTVKKDESKKLLAIIQQTKGAYVTVGVHEDAGKYPEGPSVVEVALWNEFGTRTAPERSFFRSALDENEGKINEWREEAISNMLTKGWTVKQALEMMGFRLQTLIQNKIKSNVPPPNAPSTIIAKTRSGVLPKSGLAGGREGQTSTLIDSGLMLRSITYKVFA